MGFKCYYAHTAIIDVYMRAFRDKKPGSIVSKSRPSAAL